MNLTLKTVSHRDDLLSKVIDLGDQNSKTLGILPRGAFLQHAKNKTIIAALDAGFLTGYILFRISQGKRLVSITHLCIHPSHRRKGVAKFLLEELVKKYRNNFRGISLMCRQDYEEASILWRNFGFKSMNVKRSRSKDENYLINWRYDFGNPDIFSFANDINPKIRALIDCNIIIALSDNIHDHSSDANALTADWLREEVEFVCAQESFNELHRDKDKDRANRTRQFLRKFDHVKFKPEDRDNLLKTLTDLIPGSSENDVSDKNQLAECIASDVKYFITQDEKILATKDDLNKRYALEVVSPIEFILLIDEKSNALNYHALRLAGANYGLARIRSEEIDMVIDEFSGKNKNEKQSELKARILVCAKDLKNGLVRTVKNNKSETMAMYALRAEGGSLNVYCIRIQRSKINNVLFQQLIKDIVNRAVDSVINTVAILEPQLSEQQTHILASMGFELSGDSWRKILILGQYSTPDLLEHPLMTSNFDVTVIRQKIEEAEASLKEILKVDLERKCWPVKLKDILIPTYIIPIKPRWAAQLFDYHIADSNLFGAKPELSWNRENIYYRSIKPVSEQAPARILWYLSSETKSFTGRNKGIVACSYLDGVYVDSVKIIFQRFKNYGVYEWEDVYELAKGEIMTSIKALKFSDTEVFKNIVPLLEITKIMRRHNRPKNTFASPVEVSTEIFNDIYRQAKNG
jgi:ribosomal protein S18 acetylase RimI-like enzyme/predicted nucleic acid-binding protein